MKYTHTRLHTTQSNMSKPIQLIEKPKSRADWENNKLYYRSKSFSKHQLAVVAKNENLEKEAAIAIKKRSNGGGTNNMTGCCANFPTIKKNKKYGKIAKVETMTTIAETTETKNGTESVATLKLSDEIDTINVDDWEDLLDLI